MSKKTMRDALGSSLKAEEQAVKDRFERAETVLAKGDSKKVSGKQTPPVGRVIKDSFTMPQSDYDLIAQLKKRVMMAGIETSKSEVLRAGLNALQAMSERELLKVFEGLVKVKQGRPSPE
jgi:hypothetical protein